jgi:hypothetical protein
MNLCELIYISYASREETFVNKMRNKPHEARLKYCKKIQKHMITPIQIELLYT